MELEIIEVLNSLILNNIPDSKEEFAVTPVAKIVAVFVPNRPIPEKLIQIEAQSLIAYENSNAPVAKPTSAFSSKALLPLPIRESNLKSGIWVSKEVANPRLLEIFDLIKGFGIKVLDINLCPFSFGR
jgi:hypothetical protein